MAVNPQSQSALVTRLPREILDAIYLELWRSCGLRQHILWHGDGVGKHFCSWPCTTEYDVQDGLQREVEKLRAKAGVSLGRAIKKEHDERAPDYCRRLQSPWMNHWACGERAFKKHGIKAVWGFTTSELVCWKKNKIDEEHARPRNPWLPMLLLCKLISSHCLQSIYQSTTFIFTDLKTIQMFLGYCALHPALKKWPKLGTTPPAFFKHARSLELSLSPDFPKLVLCANYDIPGIEQRHQVYDFHWLRLDRFKNLQRLDIWISARSVTWSLDWNGNGQRYGFVGIKELDVDELGQVLALLGRSVGSVTLSTPLGPSVVLEEEGEEEGYVKGVGQRGVKVYKRGDGDRFHPPLFLIEVGGTFDSFIHTTPAREVRLSCNGGNYDLMKEA